MTNVTQRDAAARIDNPAVRDAVNAAIDNSDNDDAPITAKTYAEFVAKSAARRDRIVTNVTNRFNTRVAALNNNHNVRCAGYAIAHPNVVNATNGAAVSVAIDAEMAAMETRMAQLLAARANVAALTETAA